MNLVEKLYEVLCMSFGFIIKVHNCKKQLFVMWFKGLTWQVNCLGTGQQAQSLYDDDDDVM
jgi:hypothetical protein